ncbi:hypothetical protein OIO90_004978 [Microbotryomycetes sp. JL221]|nr:hypothetical protein OIO90_004978 [Microbotryomycetes sp. JL221]
MENEEREIDATLSSTICHVVNVDMWMIVLLYNTQCLDVSATNNNVDDDELDSASLNSSTQTPQTTHHIYSSTSSTHDNPSSPSNKLDTPSTTANSTNLSSSFPLTRSKSSQQPPTCLAVLLVSFDHALGPVIEFSHPNQFQKDPDLNKTLPFLALPDGCHAREEDYSYFHVYNPSLSQTTLFGISCNRQIQSEQLINKDKTVTRSTVQKAIVVLASKPIFGSLRDKLGVVTRTFFAQRDFADKSILVDLFTSFQSVPTISSSTSSVPPPPSHDDDDDDDDFIETTEMYMGTSLRELVHKFRHKTLMLLKLLMLQRRVMFYSSTSTVESLCTLQYSLVALIPGKFTFVSHHVRLTTLIFNPKISLALMHNLQDAADPNLNTRSKQIKLTNSLKTSNKNSLIRFLGLPLNLFDLNSFFQPYLPLQQIDLLQSKSFLVGTTNSIFQQQRDSRIDVVVRIDNGTLDILNTKLSPLLSLTAADRKWMDELISTIDITNHQPVSNQTSFIGSEDFLRAKFEEYVCSMLSSIKFIDFLKSNKDHSNMLISQEELNSYNMSSWNELFIRQFRSTTAFHLWNKMTDPAIFDLVEPRHPMEGRTNPIEDVGIRLVHGLQDLHLQENFNLPTRQSITKSLTTSSEQLMIAYSFLKNETNKRTLEFKERRSSYVGGGGGGGGDEIKGKHTVGSSSSFSGTSGGCFQGGDGNMTPVSNVATSLASSVAPVGATVWAGVDVAKSGAASLATGIGSFLSSRWGGNNNQVGQKRTVSETSMKGSNQPKRDLPTMTSQPLTTTTTTITTNSSILDGQKEDPNLFLRPLVTNQNFGTTSSSSSSIKSSPGTSPVGSNVGLNPTEPNIVRRSSNASTSSATSTSTSTTGGGGGGGSGGAGAGAGFGSNVWGSIRKSLMLDGGSLGQPPTAQTASSSSSGGGGGTRPSVGERRPSQLKELELLDPNSNVVTRMSRESSAEDQLAREQRLAKRREREWSAAEAKLNGSSPP